MDYAYWVAYLAQGKLKAKTVDRPIGSSSNKRVVRLGDGSIGLRLHSTYCVIFHPDGTVTYYTGGWNTVTTFKFINDHGPVRVFRAGGNSYFSHQIGTSEPRVKKCRKCRGTGKLPRTCYPSWSAWCSPGHCYGQTRWCHIGVFDRAQEPCEHGQMTSHALSEAEPCEHGQTDSHPMTCEHGQTERHVSQPCEHGQTESHPMDPVTCWQCKGAREYDYGSKPMYLPWGGGRYRFDPANVDVELYLFTTGTPGTTLPTSKALITAPKAPPEPPAPSYAENGSILQGIMPGIMTDVTMPCECSPDMGSIRSIVIHLNDVHGWTRERIADWLDTLDIDLSFPAPEHTMT